MNPSASTPLKAAVASAFALAIAAAWVIGAQHAPPYILPSPLKVGEAAVRFFGSARQLGHLQATLTHILISIALSFTAGSALAMLAYYARWSSPAIHQRLSPFLNAFSGIGWTLLAVIWFGVSTPTVIFSIAIVLLPFALINMREGLEALDREINEMGRSFTRNGWRRFALVTAPALVPFAAATMRIMFGVAWKVALTAELFGGSQGLGYLINLARQEYDTELIFTIILFIVVAVYLTDRFVFLPVERSTARQFGGERGR
jgi:NitT/TauT family transport system permease protein